MTQQAVARNPLDSSHCERAGGKRIYQDLSGLCQKIFSSPVDKSIESYWQSQCWTGGPTLGSSEGNDARVKQPIVDTGNTLFYQITFLCHRERVEILARSSRPK
jgi:hypothetical protein